MTKCMNFGMNGYIFATNKKEQIVILKQNH